jgi:twitching motility protein PilT
MLMAGCEDPEEVIDKLLIGEMISESTAQKVIALYHRNLEKQGLKPGPSPATMPGGGSSARPASAASTTAAPPPPRAEVPPAPAPAAQVPPAPVEHVPPQGEVVHVGDGPIEVGNGGKGLILRLLKAARQVKASDLHIKAAARPIVRVYTLLKELDCPVLPPEVVERSLLECLNDRQREQFLAKNDIDFSLDTPDMGRFRGNYMREHRGMDGTFRLIPDKVPNFDDLKLPEQLRKFTTYRQGIVLVTGPKGSGKTTTLAALIDLINANRAEHIITVEDPIEFVHPSKKGHVNQREVGPHTNSFANALRAALREAPDIIMVGEMRDLETISLAITAAETGHLVFGTLHTPDAPRTINRVLDVYPPEEQPQVRTMFSESLRGIVCQQLVPGIDGKSMHLATEILFNTSAISNLIRDNRAFQVKGMMQTGKKLGMTLMDESLVKLVREHKIAKEEALARADNMAQMERDLAAPGGHAHAARH